MDFTTIILLIALTLVFIAFFAGIEIAFVSINRLSVELMKKQGKSSGHTIGKFLDQPARFIGTTLIGINIFLVIYGLLISSALHPFWIWLWKILGIANSKSLSWVQLLGDTILSTIIVLVLGEFLPKAIFRAKNDTLLSFFSGAANFFYTFFSPVASFFVGISQWMLKHLFNVRIHEKTEVFTRMDLEHFFNKAMEQDDDQELNAELFENALSLPNIRVRECLVPRTEIEGIDISETIQALKNQFVDTKLSKIVVYDGSIDNIIGYVHQLDLFKQPATIREVLLPIPTVPESMTATDLISKFSRDRKSIAWVIDEFGGTSGIITMEDLLEEIFGEIKDEYDTEELVDKQIAEDEYILSGRMELDAITEKYKLAFTGNQSETLSGYIIHEHGSIPQQKEQIIIGQYAFDILNMTDTKIETVKLKVLQLED
jgi:putative hemolysin